MMKKIACVVVTYNRKEILRHCLDAVVKQSYKPATVYIVDNASTDGTKVAVTDWGFYNTVNNGIQYQYIQNNNNEGGAGGFYRGMKCAMENGDFEAIWVMDDDGEPDALCLERLVPYLKTYDYIAPIVLSEKDHSTCSFVPDTNYEKFRERANAEGLVDDWASPMNGILFSSRLIKRIGFPKKEMFIWGDEINYHLRAKKAGFLPVTVVNAIHYHPQFLPSEMICNEHTLGVPILIYEKDWKMYCVLRNRIYNLNVIYNRYVAFKKARELYRAYIHYYHSIGDYSHDSLILDAAISGYVGYFGGLKKYFLK